MLLVNQDTGKKYVLKMSNVIGRNETCDIVINDTKISRWHAIIVREGNAWLLTDTNSSNGVRINGRRIPAGEKIRIQPGDQIVLGTVVHMCLEQEPVQSTDFNNQNNRVADFTEGNEVRKSKGSSNVSRQSSPKQKKNSGSSLIGIIFRRALIALVVYFVFYFGGVLFNGGSLSNLFGPSSSSGSKTDSITRHTSLLLIDEGDYQFFETIYFGNNSHALQAITFERHYDKSSYTRESVTASGWESCFPAYAEISIEDSGQYWSHVVHLKNLTDPDRLQALADHGVIYFTGENANNKRAYANADSLIQSDKNQGAREVTSSEALTLHILTSFE